MQGFILIFSFVLIITMAVFLAYKTFRYTEPKMGTWAWSLTILVFLITSVLLTFLGLILYDINFGLGR